MLTLCNDWGWWIKRTKKRTQDGQKRKIYSTTYWESCSHLYKLTCSKQIPFYRPNGKLVYFDRHELEGWLKQNRVNTTAEAEQAAITYVMRNKK